MTTMEKFLASDLLCFGARIHYEYGNRGDSPRRDFTHEDYCLEKQDRLGFVMDLEMLDFAFPMLSIYWSGYIDPDDASMIRWTPDGINEDIPEDERPRNYFPGVRIGAIDGQLLTKIEDIAPFFEDINGFGVRMYRTSMTFVGDNNFVRFWEQGNTNEPVAYAKFLSANVLCGEPVPAFSFDVNIRTNSYRRNACGESAIITDVPASFRAGISNVVSVGQVIDSETRYSWEFAYITDRGREVVFAVNGSTNSVISYTPDRSGVLEVTVTVEATTDSRRPMERGTSSDTFQTTVEDAETFELSSAICNLRRNVGGLNAILVKGFGESKTIGGIRIIDPLWDPAPEYQRAARLARKPLSTSQLRQIQRNMERTAKYTAEIIGKTSKLIEVRQKEEAAALKKQLKQASEPAKTQVKEVKQVKQVKPVM